MLVIEDNADAAHSLKEALEMDSRVAVEIAQTGAEGVGKEGAFHPDVVLCDIGLPGLDGNGVARAMRASAELRSTYLVTLSGYASQEDVDRSREAGFDRHVAKPPDLTALGQLVASARAAPAGQLPTTYID